MMPMNTTNILASADYLSRMMRELVEQRGMVEQEITDLEREHNDIIHELEKPECKYKERARLATKLADVRRKRRVLKNWLIDNKPYFDYIGSDDGAKMQNMLGNLVGRGRKAAKFI